MHGVDTNASILMIYEVNISANLYEVYNFKKKIKKFTQLCIKEIRIRLYLVIAE